MNSGNNRYLELPFNKTANQITAILPSDSVTLPDGFYMLFVMVDDIPSVAKIIHIQGSSLKIDGNFMSSINYFGIYPNPASNNIIINYTIDEVQNVILSIIDLSGKQITSLSLAAQKKGEHSQPFDVSGLSRGMYFVSLKTGETEIRNKVVVE
jgi:hypothetical protein